MLTDYEKRIERKEAEFITELRGVQLRLGYIISEGNMCESKPSQLPDDMAWELGIQPDSRTAQLLGVFFEYLEKKR
jgi:hypothetical protein